LNLLRGDRFTVAREILQQYGEPASGGIQTGNAAEVAGRLSSAAKLLTDTIDFEIGGTQQGRQAALRAQALSAACEQFRQVAAIRTLRPDDAQLALDDIQRSFGALQSTLSNPAGTAPSAANIARRISTMLTEAQDAVAPLPPPPTYPKPPATTPLPSAGYDQAALLAQADTVSRALQSLIQTLTSQAYQSYTYNVVLRDLDTLSAKVDEVRNSIRRGSSRERLQWEVQALNDQSARIGPQLLAGRPPLFTRLYWSSVESSLQQMTAALGTPSGGSTVLRPSPLSPDVLKLVDQAISRTDVFLSGTAPLVFGITEVPRVQRDVRNLKARLLELRQQAQDGEPAAVLGQTLSTMVTDYQSAYSRWGQIVKTNNLLNPPRLSPIGDTLNQVEQLLNDAVASEELTPATGSVALSRITRLTQTLAAEVRNFREQLPAFAGYPEHRALLTYCDQLDSYVANIDQGQSSLAVAPDSLRRQVAGMQRVIGLLQANTDSLEARAQGGGTTAARRQAPFVRSIAARIGDLADDLESELH
jgi:hypothetical protein